MNVNERLERHYQKALEFVPEERLVGVFLYGSQNYGLDSETSDVDTYAFVVPSFEEVSFLEKPLSLEVELGGEHCVLKDFRVFFQELRKQNPNCVEVLFTKFKKVNPKYEDLWKSLVEHRNDVAYYNPERTVLSFLGMMRSDFKRCENLVGRAKSKCVANLFRYDTFLDEYLSGNYEAGLRPTEELDYLRSVKFSGELDDFTQSQFYLLKRGLEKYYDYTVGLGKNLEAKTYVEDYLRALSLEFMERGMR